MLDFFFGGGSAFSLRDLFILVATDASDPHKILEKAFDWQHSRRLEFGKWLLALASSIFVAVAVATLSDKFSGASQYTYVSLLIAFLFTAGGVMTFVRAYFVGRTYVRSASLLADLIKVRAFLEQLRKQGLL